MQLSTRLLSLRDLLRSVTLLPSPTLPVSQDSMMIAEEVIALRTVIEMVVAEADSEAVADAVGMEAIVEVVEDTAVVIVAHMEETVVDIAEDVEDMEVAEKCVVVPDHLSPALLQALPTVSMLVTWSSIALPRISRSCSWNSELSLRSLSLLMPEV